MSFNQHDKRNTDREAAEARLGEEFRAPGVGLDRWVLFDAAIVLLYVIHV